jgi:plastocyanin
MSIAITYLFVAIFSETGPIALVMGGVPLMIAALIAYGWRWTPLLAVLVSGGFLAMMGGFFIGFLATHPTEPAFTPVLVLLTMAVIGIVAGVSATVQNYRRPLAERRTPRGLLSVLLVIIALMLGAILVAQAPAQSTAAGVSPEVLATMPVLQAQNFAFAQQKIRVKAGETVAIKLVNGDNEAHFFDVDKFNIHAPVLAGQEGLALFKPTEAGTYTFYCAPHYNKATGEGMQGTLIVEP